MAREFSRADRVGDQMQRELARLIQREVKDPRLGMITLSEVRVSRDYGYADIYITLLSAQELTEDDEKVQENLEILQEAAGFLRGRLGKIMTLRVIPRLRFHFDRLAGESRRMESLIRRAVDSDQGATGEPEPDGPSPDGDGDGDGERD
ncbi:MAG: 30S ribosome-binding factor RbfA [Oleiphilaceae bacterium]|nr:30S ribosome-binding factor RbfA [Oleiphilaceae bacterium]